ncbi:MAG: aldehyde dehydrogenase family protein, partial [Actinomycetota bacterium]|nr:aldehyde dehydrogenase family protein [Actinomycetota bacterium]
GWAAAPTEERAAVLRGFADLVEADAGELAELIVVEVGKLWSEALGEVEWTARSARYYADHPPPFDHRAGAIVRRRPLGVVAAITPWNVPLVTPAWKWLPALMAGNAVVWKPSELASATALAAVERLTRAGLPADVIVPVLGGGEAGDAVCGDRRVRGISFTGSTAAGRAIAALAAQRFAPCALEMSGINVAVVFADADLDLAVDCVAGASTAINGQKCTATRRVLVQRPVADEFVARLAHRYEALRPGDPLRETTTLGPLISPAASQRAQRAVAAAKRRGARVAARTAGLPDVAAAFPATLLTGLSSADPLRRHELFAPVTSVDDFDEADDVWDLANDSPYGLSAAVHTADPQTARTALDRLEAGVIAINRRGDAVDLEAPFGGVKESGNGRPEGGEYVYDSLTTLQAAYGTGAW